MTGQDIAGNMLEYAIAKQMARSAGATIQEDNISERACGDFMKQPTNVQNWLMDVAGASVAHIMQLEKETLVFKKDGVVIMQPDSKGKEGDPRDILLSLVDGGYLGVSVKLNNDVEKNQRLQRNNPDFGRMWKLGASVSENYMNEIEKVFKRLDKFRREGAEKWRDLPNLHEDIYMPVLAAFVKEFELLAQNPSVCENFVKYIIGGAFDFYKIMVYNKEIIVQGYNFCGSLCCAQPALPSALLHMYPKTKTTIIIPFDGEWTFSMRIHNARTKLENSLKWDVRMTEHPENLYSHRIPLK